MPKIIKKKQKSCKVKAQPNSFDAYNADNVLRDMENYRVARDREIDSEQASWKTKQEEYAKEFGTDQIWPRYRNFIRKYGERYLDAVKELHQSFSYELEV
jgi:hypothetical protein